jgi:hypothetical protein
MHASAGLSLRHAQPRDAGTYERARDACLVCLDAYSKTRLFVLVTALWLLSVATFAVMYFCMLVGWHSFQDRAQADILGNACMQVLTALFTYVASLTLPWRVANAVHLLSSRRASGLGVDLYGRETSAIWFHIPPAPRRVIVGMLVGNALFQYANQLTRIGWPTYAASQTTAGLVMINLTFVASLLCGVGAGVLQQLAEARVRTANPGVFPPTPLQFAIEAWKQERERARAEQLPKATLQEAVQEEEVGIELAEQPHAIEAQAGEPVGGVESWEEVGSLPSAASGMTNTDGVSCAPALLQAGEAPAEHGAAKLAALGPVDPRFVELPTLPDQAGSVDDDAQVAALQRMYLQAEMIREREMEATTKRYSGRL